MSDHDHQDDGAPTTHHLPSDLKDLLDRLHFTIIINDKDQLEDVLKNPKIGQVINEIDDNGFAAIHRAVRKEEQLPCLLAMIRRSNTGGGYCNINFDIIGMDRETPFFMAVHSNNIKGANALLEAGSKGINIMCGPTDQRKESPLHSAVKFGYEEMVVFLLKKGADINARDVGLKQTPLMVAAKMNRPQILYMLLSAGANPTPQDTDGKDALYLASENRAVHCVTLLKSDKKYLNETMSQVRVELKMEKPSVLSSDQLIAMLQERKRREEEEEKAAQEFLAKQQTSGENNNNTDDKKKQQEKQKQKEEQERKEKQEKEAADAAAAAEKYKPVPSMAVRTHDPLTGKKLPPCKTLEEVGPDSPQETPERNKQVPKNATEHIGGTRMVVGAGLPENAKEKTTAKNRPMMFVDGETIGSVAYS